MSPERWSQITEILERALELPVQERVAFLAEACGDDHELHAEIESLMGAHQAAGQSFLAGDALSQQVAGAFAFPPPDLSGQSIKQFALLKRLGLGGMGEVYLADDKALRRQVALKLLPAQTALDEERLRRFAREARAASSLNHPNIMTVHEFGQENGRHFIVTEYVEGQTLRDYLAQVSPQSPLPLEKVVAIADQILAALDTAHQAGVIHRDIKPENLILRNDGVVKVLDFGIAKVLPRVREEMQGRAAPTQFHSTQQGTVLGTPGYMSPEQVRGLQITACSDLFSFGIVFYELLAGQLPFQCETNADYISNVLNAEPLPLTTQRPELPPAYDVLLQKLLAKEPAQRIATASETREALNQLPLETLSKAATRWEQMRRAKRKLLAMSALFLTLAGLSGAAWYLYKNARDLATLKAWSDLSRIGHKELYTNKLGRELGAPAFSPDGQSIVFEMNEDRSPHLYLLSRAGGRPKQLTFGDAIDRTPVWSPDGKYLAFSSNRSSSRIRGIWKLALAGGEPEFFFEYPSLSVDLLTWRSETTGERLYFVADQNLHALNLSDRKIQAITHLPVLDKGNGRNSFNLSHEGDRLIYIEKQDQSYALKLIDLHSNEITTLLTKNDGLQSPRWMADGKHIVFVNAASGNLQPQLYSLALQQMVPLSLGSDDLTDLAVASDGRTLVGKSKSGSANIHTIDLQGQESTLTTEKDLHYLPAPSPDGETLVFQSSNEESSNGGQLLEKSLLAGANAETSLRAESVLGVQWSPDGKWLAYAKYDLLDRKLYVQSRGGKDERLVTKKLPRYWYQPLPYNLISQDFEWASDSSSIVYVTRDTQVGSQLWQTDVTGLSPRALSPLSQNINYLSPVCAPSGGRIALVAQHSRKEAQAKAVYQLLVVENHQVTVIHEKDTSLQMLGWLGNADELLVAEGVQAGFGQSQDVTVLKCRVSSRQCQPLVSLQKVYLPSLQLAPDKTILAYVAQNPRGMNIQLFKLNAKTPRSLTANSDPSFFYGGLRWAANSQQLFFSKQTSFAILHLIELKPPVK